MRCKVLKKFGHRGELQHPGSILEVPEYMYPKMSGYVLAIGSANSYSSSGWRPEPEAWLEGESLRTRGVFPGEWPDAGLTPVIIRLTEGNLPLQKKLLIECVGRYSGPPLKALKEEWEERAAIMQFDGGMSRYEAELAATKHLRLEAFIDELVNHPA